MDKYNLGLISSSVLRNLKKIECPLFWVTRLYCSWKRMAHNWSSSSALGGLWINSKPKAMSRAKEEYMPFLKSWINWTLILFETSWILWTTVWWLNWKIYIKGKSYFRFPQVWWFFVTMSLAGTAGSSDHGTVIRNRSSYLGHEHLSHVPTRVISFPRTWAVTWGSGSREQPLDWNVDCCEDSCWRNMLDAILLTHRTSCPISFYNGNCGQF